jgi:hypothetical protein
MALYAELPRTPFVGSCAQPRSYLAGFLCTDRGASRPAVHKTDNTDRTYYGPSRVGPPDRGYGAERTS